MIKAVELGKISNNYVNNDDIQLDYLDGLNKINIFIGENNSGKSRLMRSFIQSDDATDLDLIDDSQKSQFSSTKRSLYRNIDLFNSYDMYGQKQIIKGTEELKKLDDISFFCQMNYLLKSYKYVESMFTYDKKTYFKAIFSNLESLHQSLSYNKGFRKNKISDFNVCYIPTLRGIESFDVYYDLKKGALIKDIPLTDTQREALDEYKQNSKCIYSNKISSAYGIPTKHIFTAENLFDDVKDKLLGEEKDRLFIRNFEKFISDEFYNGTEFTMIPQIKLGYIKVKIGNVERPIHNLGDGIKQLITILYCMFEKKNQKAIFFIEEPELNLHPGYQRKFIEILQDYSGFKDHQVFMTTHSNHLIDNSINYDNISLYKFININNSNSKFKVIKTTNKDIEVLELLGVLNSSVFLSNCTIWVEGISDKILLSKYLQIYFNSISETRLKEDIHYSFVEYGGNNVTHWAFISNDDISSINASGITNRSMIVLDNDDDHKRKRKENLLKIFGEERYCELNVREIENTISRKVLEKTIFKGGEVIIKKQFSERDYAKKSVPMGSFIDDHYVLPKTYGVKNGTGTVKNKLDFAKKVSEKIMSIKDLSPEAKRICKKIYDFIISSNNL